MGRQHPVYCEHDFCIDPGDESFGLTEQECPFCVATEYPEMAARIADLEQQVAVLRFAWFRSKDYLTRSLDGLPTPPTTEEDGQ